MQPTDETPPEPESAKPDAKPTLARPYEPPKLTRLGSLRDLLGKSGHNFDNPQPHLKRP